MSLTQGFSNKATQNESGLYLEAADFATLFERFIQEKRSLENRSEHTLKSYKLLFWRYKKYSDALCLPTPYLLGQIRDQDAARRPLGKYLQHLHPIL